MTQQEKVRRERLFREPGGLVTTEDVAVVLRLQVVTARAYKQLGIIEPCARNGRADLYDLNEIRWTSKRLRSLKTNKTLREIAPIIAAERRVERERQPLEDRDPVDDQILQ